MSESMEVQAVVSGTLTVYIQIKFIHFSVSKFVKGKFINFSTNIWEKNKKGVGKKKKLHQKRVMS